MIVPVITTKLVVWVPGLPSVACIQEVVVTMTLNSNVTVPATSRFQQSNSSFS